MNRIGNCTLFAAFAAAALPAFAAIEVGNGSNSYGQDFDGLANAGTSVAWVNDSTLAGWSLFNKDGAAITSYAADNGGSNAGAFKSLGASGSDERALGGVGSGGSYFGSPPSGTVAGWIAVAFTNAGSSALDGFTVGWAGEQWRNGGNTSAQPMVFEYGFGASFAAVTTWTAPGGSFDFTSPVVGASAATVDGNGAGRVAGLGGEVAAAWAPGTTLWLRWTERNDSGNDHALALDDFSLSVTPVPEPGTWALLAAGLGIVVARAARKVRA